MVNVQPPFVKHQNIFPLCQLFTKYKNHELTFGTLKNYFLFIKHYLKYKIESVSFSRVRSYAYCNKT